jgi:hypothetical protein
VQSPFLSSSIAAPAPALVTQTAGTEGDEALSRLGSLYVRYRRVLFALVAGFGLLGFNGQWMVERDTSLFRGLGHSLATGKGYVFGEFATKQVYPGLPFILAGLEKVFGDTALPPLILMNLMGFGVLYFTYRLMRLHFAEWVAIAVTAGVGINATFLEMTQQIMTDVPFVLGVVLFLYGWERMRLATTYRQVFIAGGAFLLPGLVLSLSMRPTCWVLALACLLVCVWGVIAGPRRRFYATCLALVVFGALVFFFIDPRTRGFNPLGGGYERDLLATVHQLGSVVAQEFSEMFNKQLAAGFFGGRFGTGLTQVMTAVVIVSTWYLFRRGFPLWGLLVLLTMVVTLVTESIPRYYLMVLPLMMLAYVLFAADLSRRLGTRVGRAAVHRGGGHAPCAEHRAARRVHLRAALGRPGPAQEVGRPDHRGADGEGLRARGCADHRPTGADHRVPQRAVGLHAEGAILGAREPDQLPQADRGQGDRVHDPAGDEVQPQRADHGATRRARGDRANCAGDARLGIDAGDGGHRRPAGGEGLAEEPARKSPVGDDDAARAN